MPELSFEITDAKVKPYSAVPTLSFDLKITNQIPGEVYAAALKCQVIIESFRRTYSEDEKENLMEVFGKAERWEETLKSLLWTTITIPVPRFEGYTIIEVPVGCSEDHITSAGKYFYSVKDQDIPLAFLFSGTIFYGGNDGQVHVMQLSWEKEAAYHFPSSVWKEMMDTYYPTTRWLPLQNEIFDKLYKLKTRDGYSTMESCIENMIDESLQKQVVEPTALIQ